MIVSTILFLTLHAFAGPVDGPGTAYEKLRRLFTHAGDSVAVTDLDDLVAPQTWQCVVSGPGEPERVASIPALRRYVLVDDDGPLFPGGGNELLVPGEVVQDGFAEAFARAARFEASPTQLTLRADTLPPVFSAPTPMAWYVRRSGEFLAVEISTEIGQPGHAVFYSYCWR